MTYTEASSRRFDHYGENEGLNAMGRKNAQHADELLEEVARTCETIKRFLPEQLKSVHPDDWREVCIDAAYEELRDKEVYNQLSRHYDLDYYDVRSLCVVMQFNLPILEFYRGAKVTQGEVRDFLRVRNLYEHLSQQLNGRRWRNDLESVRSFRAKMQTDDEISEEAYSIDDLPQMEDDTAQYLARLDSLQHQIEAITNTVLGMGDRLTQSERTDEDQFAELDRQYDTDEEHDRSIVDLGGRLDANAQLDERQAAELARLGEVSTGHEHMIAELTDTLSELSDKVSRLEEATSTQPKQDETFTGCLFKQYKGLIAAAGITVMGVGISLVSLLKSGFRSETDAL